LSDSILKQLVFDCAMELLHGSEGLTNEEVGGKLLRMIKLHDEHSDRTVDKK
jgi:hypothetical protein